VRRRTARRLAAGAGVLLLLGAIGCVHRRAALQLGPGTATDPGSAWTPPPGTAPTPAPPGAPAAAAPAPGIPSDLLQTAAHWSLSDLVDLALRTSPVTRAAWAAARAAAADLGAQRGSAYPSLLFETDANRVKGSAVGGQFAFHSTNYEPSLSLNYLLFDFGGRGATIDASRQALLAADFTHNAAIQDTVLQVEEAYYQYINAKALVVAEQAAVKEAQASLDAATRRRESGVSTVADVLQARTALSQAKLALQTAQGQVLIIHGVVATAIGLPANTPFDIDLPPPEVPTTVFSEEVEHAIERARERRPDLAAAQAEVAQALAEIRRVRSQGLPTLTASANVGRIYYPVDGIHQDVYSTGLLLRIPVFNGLTWNYNMLKARSQADEARARLEILQQQVIYQVWESYYTLKTAEQRLQTSRDLIDSATQTFDVVSARYKAGVGSILDLLIAERDLESARSQDVQARTDYFVAVARLAHDTGTLWAERVTPAAAPEPPSSPDTKGTP
jgi:outer membrane protein